MTFPDARIRTPRVRRVSAEISRVRALNHDTLALTVALLPGEAALYPHAGQFLTLKVPGVERPRPYSLARAPGAEADGEHSLLIRLLPDGEMSAWLGAADRAGTRVVLGGPLGRFSFDRRPGPIIAIAGGSGLSAMFSLLEDACLAQIPRDCHFFYGARTAPDLYWQDAIESLQAGWHPAYHFAYTPVLSGEPAASGWAGQRGWVSDVAITAADIEWPQASAFLCGPPAMIDHAVPALIRAGVDPVHCYHDRFDDARAPAPVIDNLRCVLCDECLLVKPVADCIVETSEIERDAAGSTIGYAPHRPARNAGLYYNALMIDPAACIRCGACVDACPHDAIGHAADVPVVTLRQR